MEDQVCGVFKHGPLYEHRHQIVEELLPLLRTGDIFCRLGNEGFMGIPFSRLVARLTKSEWSHSSVVFESHRDWYMLEVNDRGTEQCRVIDWLDYCSSGAFAVYRKTDIPWSMKAEVSMQVAIRRFLYEDPDYDFNFSEPHKFYCTESTARIYEEAGFPLPKPDYLKNLIPPRAYYLGYPINWLLRTFTGTGLDVNRPVYTVGNSRQGMLSDPKIRQIYAYSAT